MDDIFIVEISTPIKYHQVWYGQFLFFYQNLNALFQKKKKKKTGRGGGWEWGGGGEEGISRGKERTCESSKGQLKKK